MTQAWKEFWREMGLPIGVVVFITLCGLYVWLNDPTRHRTCTQGAEKPDK